MIVVRDIFQLKFGRAKDAMELWKTNSQFFENEDMHNTRMMTDLTGPYYTLVMESTFNSLTDYENMMKNELKTDEWRKFYNKFVELVESGRREIFNLVDINIPTTGDKSERKTREEAYTGKAYGNR
jgi:hypothetical protein